MIFEHYLAVIRREVERTVQKLVKRPRIGLVASYDKEKHAVKVQLQPEGTLTGWIPLTAIAIGNQFGVAFAPNIKDQVEVHFEGGDQMSARVMTRHFSKADKAPQLDAGEYALIHSSGSQIKQSSDGTVRIAGAGDVAVGQVGGGKSGNTGTGNQGQGSQDAPQQQPTQQQAKNSITLKPNGEIVIDALSKDITMTLQAGDTNIWMITPSPTTKVKVASSKTAPVVAVGLVNGLPAKHLYAEST